uniref:Pentacotripeptide-repeat region of PRORP domain-containing protein n=1 Tax=Compsopogon caeruleus TaxID=31354 RepID=A0A7S1TGE3_9RHOD|mmetsp:Transcript_5061/g.10261  ORF Transcript_5061/g.10261 Transcript_5061/m.10261 type:complete len:611 (+) Transcript_5061:27-1859(+)
MPKMERGPVGWIWCVIRWDSMVEMSAGRFSPVRRVRGRSGQGSRVVGPRIPTMGVAGVGSAADVRGRHEWSGQGPWRRRLSPSDKRDRETLEVIAERGRTRVGGVTQREGNRILRRTLEQRGVEQALEVVNWLQQREWKPNLISFSILLAKVARSIPAGPRLSPQEKLKHAGLATQIFDRMVTAKIDADVILYNSLISVYARLGDTMTAVEILRRLEKTGLQPNCRSYNTVLSAFASFSTASLEEALAIFKEMNERGIEPNVVTYSTLIDICGQRGDVRICFEVFSSMRKAGVRPNILTYGSLIHSCARNGYLDAAEGLLDKLESRELASVQCYTSMIHGFTKFNKLNKAFEIFQRMCERGISPNIRTYTVLIDGAAKAGDVNLAFQLFSSLRRAGLEPNEITYSTLLHAGGRSRYLDQAFEAFEEARKVGKLPEERATFLGLVDAFGKAGDTDRALSVFQGARTAGVSIDEPMMTSLIGACSRGNEFQLVWDIFEQMKLNGLQPGKATYMALLAACANAGELVRACMVFDEMKRSGLPDEVAYNALLIACGKARDLNAAVNIFDDMKKSGIKLSLKSYASLLHAMSDKCRDRRGCKGELSASQSFGGTG